MDLRGPLRLLGDSDFRGAAAVEFSSQISRRPGYIPIATAEGCHADLATAVPT